MAKIEVRLKEEFPNPFITTMAGSIIRHEEWSTVDEDDPQVKVLLQQNSFIEVKGSESLKEKIIMDTPQEKTLKEVVTPTAIQENKEALKEAQEKEKESSPQQSEVQNDGNPEIS